MSYMLSSILSFDSPVCILHLQHISVWTGAISGAQEPHVATVVLNYGIHRLVMCWLYFLKWTLNKYIVFQVKQSLI